MITEQQVVAWLKLPASDDVVKQVVAAVNELVDGMPTAPRDKAGAWAKQTVQAAIMLAARLHRRRNSPSGVEAMTEAGASYVSRYDSDIARMLRIDSFTPPLIG